MGDIIRPNYGIEKLVRNPFFRKTRPFDYSVGDKNSLVDVALRLGIRAKVKPLFRDGVKNEIKRLDIRRVDDYDEESFQILLVPVGFTSKEADEVLGEIAVKLKKPFRQVPVQFSYSSVSMSIDIDHVERWAFFADETKRNSLVKKLRKIVPVSTIAAVLNTNEFMGGSLEGVAVFSGRNEDSLYIVCHELGHSLGLDDGYESYYGSVNNTELFTALSALPSSVRYAARKFNAPIYNTGNHFNGKAVYRFYKRSIMADYLEYYQRQLERGKPVFNDIQNHVMSIEAKKAVRI